MWSHAPSRGSAEPLEGGKGTFIVGYGKLLSMCAAVAVTSGGLFLLASPASARAPIVVTAPLAEDIIVRHVSYADLNLAAAAGLNTLNSRVGGAVEDLCTEAVGGYESGITFKFNMVRCSRDAWSGARPQIAQAVQRAHDIAFTGTSNLAAVAITISLPE